MCKVGDIVFIRNYTTHDGRLSSHPFIVVDDQNGKIQGLEFDLACSVMSSFDNKQAGYKERKLSYIENLAFEISDGNTRDGYIKADQMYLFNKEDVELRILGSATDEMIEELLDLIESLREKGLLEAIIENIK